MSRLHPIEIPMHDEDEVVELSDGRLAREELSLRHGRNCLRGISGCGGFTAMIDSPSRLVISPIGAHASSVRSRDSAPKPSAGGGDPSVETDWEIKDICWSHGATSPCLVAALGDAHIRTWAVSGGKKVSIEPSIDFGLEKLGAKGARHAAWEGQDVLAVSTPHHIFVLGNITEKGIEPTVFFAAPLEGCGGAARCGQLAWVNSSSPTKRLCVVRTNDILVLAWEGVPWGEPRQQVLACSGPPRALCSVQGHLVAVSCDAQVATSAVGAGGGGGVASGLLIAARPASPPPSAAEDEGVLDLTKGRLKGGGGPLDLTRGGLGGGLGGGMLEVTMGRIGGGPRGFLDLSAGLAGIDVSGGGGRQKEEETTMSCSSVTLWGVGANVVTSHALPGLLVPDLLASAGGWISAGASTAGQIKVLRVDGGSAGTLQAPASHSIKGIAAGGNGEMVIAVGSRKGGAGFASVGAAKWRVSLSLASTQVADDAGRVQGVGFEVLAAIKSLASSMDTRFDQVFGLLADHSLRLEALQAAVRSGP